YDRYSRREYWTMPITLTGGAAGDCEDYALEKRRALLELGWPAASLRLAVADSRWTGPHTVLVVVTTAGDFVLDNLSDQVKPWSKTPYEWRKRQSGVSDLDWRQVATSPVRMASYRGQSAAVEQATGAPTQ
ncbi:MAG: transglutaminase-like cysteine peptidase, partial [Pseudomonadota bacterium]